MKPYQKIGGIGYLLQGLLILGGGFLEALVFAQIPGVTPSIGASNPATPSSGGPIVGEIILLVIFAAAAAPTILSCVGWLLAGRDRKRSLFIATGAVGISALGLIVASFFYLFARIGSSTATATQATSSPPIAFFLVFIALEGIGSLLALAFVILSIVSLFSAAKEFGIPYFRYAGFSYVAAIVGSIIGSIVIFAALFSSFVPPTAAGQTVTPNINAFIRGFIVAIPLITAPAAIASILAGLAFFKPPMGSVETAAVQPVIPPLQESPVGPVQMPDNAQKGTREKYVALALIAIVLVSSVVVSAAAYDGYKGTSITSVSTATTFTSTSEATSIASSGCADLGNGQPPGPVLGLTVGASGVTDSPYGPYDNGNFETGYIVSQLNLASDSVVTGQITSDNGLDVFIYCAPASSPGTVALPSRSDLVDYVFSSGPVSAVTMNVTLPPGNYYLLLINPSNSVSRITVTQDVEVNPV